MKASPMLGYEVNTKLKIKKAQACNIIMILQMNNCTIVLINYPSNTKLQIKGQQLCSWKQMVLLA